MCAPDYMGAVATQVATRRTLLKAAGAPEAAEIARVTAGLESRLVTLHESAARKAVKAAASAARRGRGLSGVRAVEGAARRAYNGAFVKPAVQAVQREVATFYALGKLGALRRLQTSKAKSPTKTSLQVSFTQQDTDAVKALKRQQTFWIGNHYNKNLRDYVRSAAAHTMVEQGLTGAAAGKQMQAGLASKFGLVPRDAPSPLPGTMTIPTGFRGSQQAYMRGLATHVSTTGRVFGSVNGMKEAGVTEVEITNPLDARTCDRCRMMNGKRFKLSQAEAQMKGVLAAKKPAAVRAAQPWLKVSTFRGLTKGPGHISDADSAGLANAGVVLPPYHFYCRCTIDIVPGAFAPVAIPKPDNRPAHEKPMRWKEKELREVKDTAITGEGVHEKFLYESPDGARWLFKPVREEFFAWGEKGANDLMFGLELEGSEMHVVKMRGKTGTIQKLHSDVRGNLKGVPLEQLDDAAADALFRESAFDWLIGNHDGHGANMLRLGDSRIAGIDKGQAFKNLLRDRLTLDYNPNAPWVSVQNDQLRRYARGELGDWALPDPKKMKSLQRLFKGVEEMSDDRYLAFWDKYLSFGVESRFSGVSNVGRDEFAKRILERKHLFREQYTKFLEDVEKARRQALGVTDAAPAKLVSPLNYNYMKNLRQADWRGRSLMVGSPDIEDMHVLLQPMRNDGLWMEMKVRAGADRKILQAIGQEGTSSAATAAEASDPYYSDILKAAKSINAHLDAALKHSQYNGAVPAHTQKLVEEIYTKLLAHTMQPAEYPSATHYIKFMNQLASYKSVGGKVVATFDKGNKALMSGGNKLEKFVAKAPKKTPKIPKAELPPGVTIKPTEVRSVGSSSYPRRLRPDGGVDIDLAAGPEQWGTAYEIDLGKGLKAYYEPHQDGVRYARQGYLRVWVDKPNATAGDIKKGLAALEKMGLQTPMATADHMELLYLRKVTYAAGLEDSAAFSVAEDLPVKDQIRKLVSAWTDRLGKDPRKLKAYKPMPQWDTANIDGRPRWTRFDNVDDIATLKSEGYLLTHSGADPEVLLQGTKALASTEERLRVGISTKRSISEMGMSAHTDTGTGGSSYTFMRLKKKPLSRGGSKPTLHFKADILADTDAISYGGDKFGKVTPEVVRSQRARSLSDLRRHAGVSNNETIFKYRTSLEKYLHEVIVSSETKKRSVLRAFKEAGISKVGGRPVERAVIVR